MPQYFAKPGNIAGNDFLLGEDESRHAVKSARIKQGNVIRIFDGAGTQCSGVVEKCGKNVSGKITSKNFCRRGEPGIILSFGLVARNALEKLVDYATQAGVCALEPVICERTQRGSVANFSGKKERYEKIALSACKQSERAYLPRFAPLTPFRDSLDFSGPKILCRREASGKLEEFGRKAGEIKIFIGPEGGFSEREIRLAAAAGTSFLKISENVLRSELAAPLAVSKVLAVF